MPGTKTKNAGTPRGNRGGGDGKSFRPYHSTNVPKEVDLESAFLHTDADEPITTLMLRHIPNKYSQSSLLKEIDFKGFQGKYDFFYMPMDVHNRTNVGYAFINLVTTRDARDFFLMFSNYRFEFHASGKIGAVSPGHVQGLENNVCHFGHRAVATAQNVQYRPLVFRDGKQVDLKAVFQELQKGRQVPELLKPPSSGSLVQAAKMMAPGPVDGQTEVEDFCPRVADSALPCSERSGLPRSLSASTSATSTDKKEDAALAPQTPCKDAGHAADLISQAFH
ncbi:unnamed protein product [Durusdinium trenchii]|uniref:Mei2-like C-terminal RNA recognition motif domain-containing protein n=1 Tax=Durusdinium trenchii TaxID=1381693 RepID=A0ABP0KQC0_9DINO